jgi:hypothetical protein
MSRTLNGLAGALPDSVTCLYFMVLWIAPLHFGAESVRNGMLIMLVEFVLVHATGFIGVIVLEAAGSRLKVVGVVLGFALFYLVFIAAWSYIFEQWWPFLAFGWLLLGKFSHAMNPDMNSPSRRQTMQSDWVNAGVTYVIGVFITSILPVPQFGIDSAVIAQLHLPGSGVWVEQPQKVIAFGVLYFGALAWTKSKP